MDSECATVSVGCEWTASDPRLVYGEVVEARSNYKLFSLWWFRNPTCGDSTGSNQIEKDWVGGPPGLVWRKREGEVVWFSACQVPLDDYANGGSVDVFFTYDEYDFSSLGICGQNYVVLVKCQQSYSPEIWY